MLRALAVAVAVALLALAPAHALAGTVAVAGSELVYSGDAGADTIAAFETAEAIHFASIGTTDLSAPDNTCTADSSGQSVVCPKAGVASVTLELRDGDDVAAVAATLTLPVTLRGGDGDDGLYGGGGTDTIDAGAGDDTVDARDGRDETVSCGDGDDTAIADDGDARTSCERIEGDADLDGVRRPADCDDANPAIRPGAIDLPDNGADENCDGADATDVDRDRDGVARPQDCDDAEPAIRPGAREVRGNAVDENCDTRIEPFPPLLGSISVRWAKAGAATRNLRLVARKFLRGATIEVRCRGGGCPSRTFRRTVRSSSENLQRALGKRVLRRGARLEVRVTSASRIGRLLRFRFTRPGQPDVDFLCLPPGGGTRDC